MEYKHNQKGGNQNLSLQIKLQQLEKKRSFLVEELRSVALDGDLSENFDWVVTLQKIEKLGKEISLLKQKITTANQNLSLSKIVTYQLLETKQNKTVQLTDFLLEEKENNPFQKKTSLKQASFSSPLGLTLANKKIGEIGKVETKKGSYWIKIINIEEK
ncbi:MAG: GreA/GreB family elongation factor [Candidatus Moeniiplasma glomeromycotorum]|nr:GreA/GreB family elongation factor [Candidatus Moeniiplasma glomeromycotorum]MCE8162364.1 GreA/GreB family elongation factor [Candidatus Moeniiplasma glomeromycotorum]MCE8163807.1 GreA/GreB family elongation factor [Candidatus Moeniiplasma glomeromycotorum]MCE8166288.1 GreA/GreB family elongation factor [Candidatus Moeniiplasma glomeromycotorum]MCE8166770.1 GreA/GreB family elongation factor [Candidatus Moeniiplasma glomeromycotorum]